MTATSRLDEVEVLRMQNIRLRSRVLELEQKAFEAELIRKYSDGGDITIRDDGTIERSSQVNAAKPVEP